ncbi:hypothetical protein J2Z66_002231 [Paenibacillus eucommiae]|uniref:Uncharacterized protein n=1 Tax=Paenibacillus eucommiae TaxID=1355755 RepID=A0ABS4IU43_9BACL|nr:hypothetical protein [Paenibacillus eucommiae]
MEYKYGAWVGDLEYGVWSMSMNMEYGKGYGE